MTAKILCFGEIMLRLSPPDFQRLGQSNPGTLSTNIAGAEANVAVSLAQWGIPSSLITVIPDHHAIANSCLDRIRGYGVDTSQTQKSPKGRLGLYFVEQGMNQRSGQVIYDRNHSSFSLSASDTFNWNEHLKDFTHLHVTGITPALSKSCFEMTHELFKTAKENNIFISFDLNYREKLWNWHEHFSPLELAKDCFSKLMPHVDLLIANELHCKMCLNLDEATNSSATTELDQHVAVAKKVLAAYPNLEKVAFTLRHSESAHHHRWGAMLLDREDQDHPVTAPNLKGAFQAYEIQNVIDRIGAGDAFAAGLLYGLCSGLDHQSSMDYAAASACLAHSIPGDFNLFTKAEIQNLASSPNAWWIKR